jgi:flagellar hook assembly protein FlgD
VLQLVGTAGSRTYSAPSARPVTPIQIASYSAVFDRVAPVVTSASASGNRLSPNGDGRFDTLTFRMTATGSTTWDFSVARLTGSTVGPPVRTVAGIGTRAFYTWNGRSDSGTVVPDGTYRVTLRMLDPAGNRAARSGAIVVDNRPAGIVAIAGPSPISPNGDNAADAAALHWTSDERVSGVVAVIRGSKVVRRWAFSGRTGGAISWNGRDGSGRGAPDGIYRLRVDAYDATGNRTVVDRTVVVDRTAGFLRWASPAFYPQDGDALRSTSRLNFRLARSAMVNLAIVDARGVLVRNVWTARTLAAGTRTWTWDGRAASGAFVTPGTYAAVLTVRTQFGTTILVRSVFAGAFRVTPVATTLTPGTLFTLTFSAVEPLRTRPVVTFLQTGLPAVARSATRLADGSYRVQFLVRTGKGPASVVIAATDTGGHANRQSLALVVR